MWVDGTWPEKWNLRCPSQLSILNFAADLFKVFDAAGQWIYLWQSKGCDFMYVLQYLSLLHEQRATVPNISYKE